MEYIPTWRPLIQFLGNFGKSEGRGISTLNLPGLPHPSILQEVMSALNSGREGYNTEYIERDDESFETEDPPDCWNCFRSGWTCFEYDEECTRFTRNKMVSITKDSTWPDIDGRGR